jgi:signal transduction histidine kinase
MATLGQLAGGIVHDFKDILYVIRLYSELLSGKQSLGKDDLQAIEKIGQAARRASSLTAHLLAFSRQEVLQPILVNLNTVVSTMESMLRQLFRRNIVVSTVLAPSLGQVKADPTQLEQVLLNMMVNARDAMPQGGEVTIETANVEFDESFVRQHHGSRAGPQVMLSVRDTGIGMDGATQARLFKPFFTTKEAGKGTGLGLSIIYGIIKQCGGYITVDSVPGHGTTFRVYLPRETESNESAGSVFAESKLS